MAHGILAVVETNIAELAIAAATRGAPAQSGGDPAAAASASQTAAPASGGASKPRHGGARPMLDTSSMDQPRALHLSVHVATCG